MKVVPDNENPVSYMTTDKNSKITSGHYVAGKTLVVTYIWVKDTKSPEPVVPTPSEPTIRSLKSLRRQNLLNLRSLLRKFIKSMLFTRNINHGIRIVGYMLKSNGM